MSYSGCLQVSTSHVFSLDTFNVVADVEDDLGSKGALEHPVALGVKHNPPDSVGSVVAEPAEEGVVVADLDAEAERTNGFDRGFESRQGKSSLKSVQQDYWNEI